MNDLDSEIAKLLRLKRYEHPTEEYYEGFLHEFQRRQRIESMKLSLWEKVTAYFSSLTECIHVPGYAYGMAGAAALVVSSWILIDPMSSNPADASTGGVAAVDAPLHLSITSDAPSAFEAVHPPVTIPSQRFVGTLPPQYLLHKSPVPENDPFRF